MQKLHTHLHTLNRLGKHFKILLRGAVHRFVILAAGSETVPMYITTIIPNVDALFRQTEGFPEIQATACATIPWYCAL